MPKLLCILLAGVMGLTFCACRDDSSPWEQHLTEGCVLATYNKETETYEHYYTHDDRLVFSTEYEEYPSHVDDIEYTITNVSDEETAIGEEQYLARLTDGEWKIVNCNCDVHYVHDIALIIAPHSSYEGNFDLEDEFDIPLPPGQYRIVTNSGVTNTFTVG